jgi:hypothetical protein
MSASHVARGRIGGLTTASRHDMQAVSRPGREAFLARFEREVDPNGVLPVTERARRAEAAKKAYFAGLALKSVQKRQAVRRRGKSTKESPAL